MRNLLSTNSRAVIPAPIPDIAPGDLGVRQAAVEQRKQHGDDAQRDAGVHHLPDLEEPGAGEQVTDEAAQHG